ncbi:EAL domain-containing protein [Labrenzia sp. VG12]|uniref:EAL domain-containing protein n=1 Tax=Labrenzia sp. VG12 TaxID=2021862 RepID=UPI0012FD08C2|nr:EAL domain-containing protein [Labrenzia sp. VG12]
MGFRETSGKRVTALLALFLVLPLWAASSSWAAPKGKGALAAQTQPRVVVAAVPENWPPHYSLSATGEPQGFAIDVFDHLSAQLGFTVEYSVAKTFAEANRRLEDGTADVVPNSGIVPQRLGSSLFTDPVETFRIVIFVRDGSASVNTFGSLHGKSVGVVINNVGLYLLRDRKDIDLTVYEDPEHALFGLLSGSVDAVVYPDTVFSGLARRLKVEDKIKIVGAPMREVPRGLQFRKDSADLHAAYSAAVTAFLLSPEYNAIYTKWYGTPEPFWSRSRIVFAMSVLMAVLCTGFVIWRFLSLRNMNRTLRNTQAKLATLNLDLENRVRDRTADLTHEIEQRKHSQHVVEAFFNQTQSLNLVVDYKGKIKRMNDAWFEVLGFGLEELQSSPFMSLVHPADLDRTREAFSGLLEGIDVDGFENRWRCKNGNYRNLLWSARTDRTDGLVYAVAKDVTLQKEAESKLKLSASVFTVADEGIIIADPNGVIVDVNEAFTEITGYDRHEVLGKNARMLKSGRHNKAFYKDMWRALQDEGAWRGEIWNKTKDGRVYPEILTISAVQGADGKTANFVGLFSDISAIKDHEQELEHLAQYDKLTGLPNRALLADRLNQAMARAKRHDHHIAVVFIDLDGFKTVNDTLGHAAGDSLLVATSRRLKSMLRSEDTLARIGGDEFVAIITDLNDPMDCIGTLDRLKTAAAAPFDIDDHAVKVTASAGVTFFPQTQAIDADQLERQADQAMYEAKLAGRNQYRFFNPDQDKEIASQFARVAEAQKALEEGEFLLHYQPKVDLESGRLLGCEALLRWQHPKRGLLLPGDFLPPIEQNPSIAVPLGNWVIGSALQQIETWRTSGLDIGVSVNASAVHLLASDFVGKLEAQLARHPDADPERLEIEILETSAINDFDKIADIIRHCTQLGVRFALDDFGTGYSSLVYLKQLPLHTLKIDQGFVRDMLHNREDQEILKSIVGFGRIFDLEVLAEGVETEEHGRMLQSIGCRFAQGFAIARPMPAEDIPGWCLQWTRRYACPGPRLKNQATG